MRRIILIFMFVSFIVYGYKLKEYPHKFVDKMEVKAGHIYDGDTFDMLHYGGKMPIRLYGIDTPELKSPQAKSEKEKYYGKMAKEFLISKLTNEIVSVEAIRYGKSKRQDSIVTIGRGKNKEIINEELLKEGLALVAEIYCNPEDIERYKALEEQAKVNQKGFWADKSFYPDIVRLKSKYAKKK